MSCSSSNNNAGVGNDNPRSIGIVSPLAVGAAVVPNVVPDTNDDTKQQYAVAYPQNRSHRGGSIATAATAGPFSPLATAPPPRTLMSAPYSSTAAGQNSNDNNSKNLFHSTPPPSSASSLLSPTATSKCNKAVVVLNVGGCQFTTSRSTLCSVEGSQLEAMFSGRHGFCAHQMEDGSYFIDRDGSHFRHILNFLRTGSVVTLPKTEAEKQELAVEADYYGLDGMVRAIRMPKIDIDLHLDEKTLQQRQEECELRDAFLMNHQSHDDIRENGSSSSSSRICITSDPFQGLIPIFSPDDGIPLPLLFDPDCALRKKTDCLFMSNVCVNRKSSTKRPPVCVDSLETFRTNFNKEWPNVLHRIDQILVDEPVVIAGGSVLRALTASDKIRTGGDAMWGDKASDIDIFLYAREAQDASRIARRIFYALAVDDERWVVIRSRGVVNIHNFGARGSVETKIQLILRLYDSPTEVLLGFDVDCCLCAYDGRNVWLAPRCVSALESGTNVLNPLHAWPNRPSYEIRLAKYAARGFAVVVPGSDKRRIDYPSILRSPLKDLKGMARFIKVAAEMENATIKKRYDWRLRTTVERAKTPREIEGLKEGELTTATDDERVVDVRCDRDELYDDVSSVITPSIYGDNEHPIHLDWTYNENFPPSRDSREAAWEDIMDPGEERCPESVPRRLDDAWDSTKRSREYLNASMDKFDLENLYYSHAYYQV